MGLVGSHLTPSQFDDVIDSTQIHVQNCVGWLDEQAVAVELIRKVVRFFRHAGVGKSIIDVADFLENRAELIPFCDVAFVETNVGDVFFRRIHIDNVDRGFSLSQEPCGGVSNARRSSCWLACQSLCKTE